MPADEPFADESVLVLAARALVTGGAVIIPTDTVYGLAVSPEVRGATEHLFALKQRPAEQPLAVLVASARAGPRPRRARGPRAGGLGPGRGAHPAVVAGGAHVGPAPRPRRLRLRPGRLARHHRRALPRVPAGPCPRRAGGPAGHHQRQRPRRAHAGHRGRSGRRAARRGGGGGRRRALHRPPSTVLDVSTTPWRLLREGGVSAADLGLAHPEARGDLVTGLRIAAAAMAAGLVVLFVFRRSNLDDARGRRSDRGRRAAGGRHVRRPHRGAPRPLSPAGVRSRARRRR